MSKNHRNRSSRAQWITDSLSCVVLHKSGFKATGFKHNDDIKFDSEKVDKNRWDIALLKNKAIQLIKILKNAQGYTQ